MREQVYTFSVSAPSEAAAGLHGYYRTITISIEGGDVVGEPDEFEKRMSAALKDWFDEAAVVPVAVPGEEWFGQVRWCDDDIQARAEELLNRHLTDKELADVLDSYYIRHINDRMIEAGWENIEEAIRDRVQYPDSESPVKTTDEFTSMDDVNFYEPKGE